MDEAKEKEEQQQDEVVANLMIAAALHESSQGIFTVENGHAVTSEGCHFHHDWAFLRVLRLLECPAVPGHSHFIF